MPTTRVIIDPRFSGPPDSANGGYAAGVLAEQLGNSARVRLSAPVPVGRALTLLVDGATAELRDGTTVLASATAHPGPPPPREPVTVAAAQAALDHRPDVSQHPFPTCFVCGPARAPGDGLRLLPGRLPDRTMATPWTPGPTLADGAGAMSDRFLWAALDCPGHFPVVDDDEAAVLGTITGHVARSVRADEELVVVARPVALDGRKRVSATAVFNAGGEAVAWAESIWIVVEPGSGGV